MEWMKWAENQLGALQGQRVIVVRHRAEGGREKLDGGKRGEERRKRGVFRVLRWCGVQKRW
jgi:hypothetical protein